MKQSLGRLASRNAMALSCWMPYHQAIKVRSPKSNTGIRTEALKTIDDIRDLVHKKCGRVVSSTDIVALAGCDSIVLLRNPPFVLTSILKCSRHVSWLFAVVENIEGPFIAKDSHDSPPAPLIFVLVYRTRTSEKGSSSGNL